MQTVPLRSGQTLGPTSDLSKKLKPQREHTQPAQKAAQPCHGLSPASLSSSDPQVHPTQTQMWTVSKPQSLGVSLRPAESREPRSRAPSASVLWPIIQQEAAPPTYTQSTLVRLPSDFYENVICSLSE